MAATITEVKLNTTASTTNNVTIVQLPVTSGTGWSSSASTLTLSPPSGSTPAIYGVTINAPAGFLFTGTGTSLSFGSGPNADVTYVVMADTQTEQPVAYLIACDGDPGSASNSLTLNLTDGTNPSTLTATIQF